jgi:hypothetical protein
MVSCTHSRRSAGQRGAIDQHCVDAAGLGNQRHDGAVFGCQGTVDDLGHLSRAGEHDASHAGGLFSRFGQHGVAAIASTVGAKTLGSPIIVGLSRFNTAYIMQGAVLVGLLAVVTDMAFERLAKRVAWHA